MKTIFVCVQKMKKLKSTFIYVTKVKLIRKFSMKMFCRKNDDKLNIAKSFVRKVKTD